MIRLVKERFQIGFSKDVKWQLKPFRYSTMGKEAIVRHASADSGITPSQLEQAFEAIAHEIDQMVPNGHGIELGGLGKLRLSISAKAVRTAENVSADLIKRSRILFHPSPAFRKELYQTPLTIDKEVRKTKKFVPVDEVPEGGEPEDGAE